MRLARNFVCAVVVTAIGAATAQAGSPPAFRASRVHHEPDKSVNSKGLPRSTTGAAPVARSGSADSAQVQHLERQTANELRSASRRGKSASGGHGQLAHSESPGHGSGINFGYHPIGAKGTSNRTH